MQARRQRMRFQLLQEQTMTSAYSSEMVRSYIVHHNILEQHKHHHVLFTAMLHSGPVQAIPVKVTHKGAIAIAP